MEGNYPLNILFRKAEMREKNSISITYWAFYLKKITEKSDSIFRIKFFFITFYLNQSILKIPEQKTLPFLERIAYLFNRSSDGT